MRPSDCLKTLWFHSIEFHRMNIHHRVQNIKDVEITKIHVFLSQFGTQ